MFLLRLELPVVLLFAVAAVAQDRTQLIGTKEWKVVKSEEAPPGTKMLFGADGKLVLTFAIEGKSREMNGTFALAGNQLTLKLAHDGKERVEVRTIKKLTDTVLITEDRNHKIEELQR
ncbi:MAG TPA: hypothetical protein VHR66_00180 [Gemmataceae bacterium]|jgi:uncharacterized protein (TIGR03066 family)|nr:hypothetical protein [Gemmataceae bacterium]